MTLKSKYVHTADRKSVVQMQAIINTQTRVCLPYDKQCNYCKCEEELDSIPHKGQV